MISVRGKAAKYAAFHRPLRRIWIINCVRDDPAGVSDRNGQTNAKWDFGVQFTHIIVHSDDHHC